MAETSDQQTGSSPLTADDVHHALQLACDVRNERQERKYGFRGAPPKPGSWIPRDDSDDEDEDPRHTTKFGGLRERP